MDGLGARRGANWAFANAKAAAQHGCTLQPLSLQAPYRMSQAERRCTRTTLNQRSSKVQEAIHS